jgi:hypothetical protein
VKGVISYSLFGDPNSWEFGYYLRGTYLNLRMNKILYPNLHSIIYTTPELIERYYDLWIAYGNLFKNIAIQKKDNNPPKCLGMLWRMLPIFSSNYDFVICRDLDSVSTYREALCMYEWINSGFSFHGINDNDAHGGLMGGLVSFNCDRFKEKTGYTTFEQMVKGLNLQAHGSDQNFLNKSIHPKIKNDLFMHTLKGAGCSAAHIKNDVLPGSLDKKLWLADLISRYIGSAGVIDFETIRFLRSFDKDLRYIEMEKKFKDIFYWAR